MMIRAATGKDLEQLCGLDKIAQNHPERKRLITNAIKDLRAWLLESSNGQIVGYGVLNHGFFGLTFIELIYIDEQFRCKGLGPKLIHYLEKQSQSEDIFTSTNESNLHMQHVLSALGYEGSGTIFNLDPSDPERVFVKKLKDGQ